MVAATKKETAKVSKELQREDPNFLPTTYGLTKAKIAKLKKEYDITTIPESLAKGDSAYEVIHKKAMAIVKVRTSIEKRKKELTDDARKWTNEVNSEAKRLTEVVEEIEKPWKDRKAELDNAAEIKAEQERTAELARTEAIEARIAVIQNVTADLVGATAAELSDRLNLANTFIVDESFEEYETAAATHKENAISLLTGAVAEREVFEAQQEELEKGRLELAEAKAELAKLKNETFEPEEREAFIPAAETADAVTQSENVEPYINLTEPQMVKDYMMQLVNVEAPDVGDDAMVNLVLQITSTLTKLSGFVDVNTQGG